MSSQKGGPASGVGETAARRLRVLLQAGALEPMVGSYNALSAQIIEKAGVKCTLLGGSAVSDLA